MSDERRALQRAILEELRWVWEAHPDWRLGQLVSNLMGMGRQDVFFLPDEKLYKLIGAWLNGGWDAVREVQDEEWISRTVPPESVTVLNPEDFDKLLEALKQEDEDAKDRPADEV